MSASCSEMDCDDISGTNEYDFTSSDESESSSEYSEDSVESEDDVLEEEIEVESEHEDFSFDMPWTENGIPRPPFPFTATSGVQVDDIPDVLDVFESFFDDALIELIVEETNRFAVQFIINNHGKLKEQSRVRKWTQTNKNEIRTLLGLLILQGINPKPEYKMYFSRRHSIETPFFPKVMSERRFHLLIKFLHFVDNSTINENTKCRKLAKILPVLNHLRGKFMSTYLPERDVSIDESLIGWKGRLSWKQYIPSKRKRFGMKMFALCESSSGYMFNFIIYTGCDTDYGEKYSNEPVTARIVLSLMDPLLGKGYRLFLDNFYTSVDLADKLVKNRTDCVGTMRLNRKGVPTDIKKKLSKGENVARYRKKIMVQKWRDKKDVLMLSTIHDGSMGTIQKRTGDVEKPLCILEYNSKMGGVDLTDNYLHFYGTTRSRVKKFYMKIFWHFLSVTTLNSYHIYKKSGGKLKRLNFLIELGEKLVEKYNQSNSRQRRRSKTPLPTRYSERHFPSVIPPTTKQKPTKRCQM
ncbi:unnamed protein product [Acanthoscelides obtectus]|uniref:PiggyBac transposable element-derived protein domain-containing protein n=1 Tax=Acanthoscelides obtectus TaxID=200917 RepID=A0A9P0LNZ1_ACAOB|nr:unnamed protein product [Acanthoscelides obtectus]CAK1681247.1 PiggyBac transposable element-derived protein 4 [Acanthoscelides obtectus]